jgi:hypothetical protein
MNILGWLGLSCCLLGVVSFGLDLIHSVRPRLTTACPPALSLYRTGQNGSKRKSGDMKGKGGMRQLKR